VRDKHLARVIASLLAASMAGLGSAAVYAQQEAPPPPPAEGQEEAVGLGSIMVEAQKRTESLQEVPLSIAAFTADELVKVAPVTIEDLNHLVPNVELEHVGLFRGAASFSMRGVGTSGIESFADPAVAVFINNIYQARNAIALSSTLDIEAIEVMRGPQGTIYGRNAYAGAIALRTKKPELDEFGGMAKLTYGNFNTADADLVLNIPFTPGEFAGRLAIRSHESDGFYRNSGYVSTANPPNDPNAFDPNLHGQPLTGEKTLYIRPSLRWANDALDITLFGEVFRDRSDPGLALNQTFDPESVSNGLCGPVGAVDQPVNPGTGLQCNMGLFESFGWVGNDPWGDAQRGIPGDGSDPWSVGFNLYQGTQEVDSWNTTLQTTYTMDSGTFNLTLNYGDVDEEVWSDTDGENVNLFSSARWQDYETYTVDAYWASDFEGSIDLLAGVFYFYDKYVTGQVSFPISDANPLFVTTLPNLSYGTNTSKRDSWAAWAQAEWHLNDQWSLVAGGRYSEEKKYDAFGQAIVSIALTGVPPGSDFASYPTGPGQPVFGPNEDSWDSFAPRVGINWKASDDLFLFAFFQRAFKSGGFNMNANVAEVFNTPFDQEQADNYEVGIKSEWLDNRLRLNANVFHTEYKDVQRNILRPAATGVGVITFTGNAASLEADGVELEITAAPTDALTLYANAGWLDAGYTDFCAELDGAETTTTPQSGRAVCGSTTTITPAVPTAFIYLVETDWSDLEPVRAPELEYTIGATYDFVLGGGVLTADANWNHTDPLYTDLLNRERSDRDDLDVLNASLRWQPDSGQYEIVLWGRNLTNDVERLNVAFVSNVWAFANGTQPMTYGASVQVNF
jgi:iron complex outermembrane recepter protein